ncbi:Yat1 [Kluyveromyces lactis]|nr:Yat1 [Kluyveromyces lactis]
MPSIKDSNQEVLPRLPIPPLEDTLKRYLARLEPLQDARSYEKTKRAVAESEQSLRIIDHELRKYDEHLAQREPMSSYIEQFWFDSYLEYDESVVLNLNPYFQLADDPTMNNVPKVSSRFSHFNRQVKRTSKLVVSMLKFVKAIRTGTLPTDNVRGKSMTMDQYGKLFGSSRLPPSLNDSALSSCHLQTDPTSHHVVIMYKSQFYWFDVLDINNEPIFQQPEELEWNLYSIIMDSEQNSLDQNLQNSCPMGVFTTENRRVWSNVRDYISKSEDQTNWRNLKIIDSALFIICLDDSDLEDERDWIKSMICGTSKIDLNDKDEDKTKPSLGLQTGTCTNRWYDKLQLIVDRGGRAGINFEHTGVDGHTVLRMTMDIYTDSIVNFAQGITRNVPKVFEDDDDDRRANRSTKQANLITIPRKLEWSVDSFILSSMHFAETRASDLISQIEFEYLDFKQFGAAHIKNQFKCSPDAFLQMCFQTAYYALYGKFETTYEPAMTKFFQNGRTEAIRTVSDQSKSFVKSFFNTAVSNPDKIKLLQEACKQHSNVTRECSMGLGQDRHLYALYCIWKKVFAKDPKVPLPQLFQDAGWSTLNTNVISTSNCGNPCLKNFGFGPVCSNGFGIGYIIRNDTLSVVVSSRHRQTARFVELMQRFLLEINRIVRNEEQSSKTSMGSLQSDNMKYLLSGYDYFDVSVTG